MRIMEFVGDQKRAIRVLSNSHFLAHTEPLFKFENILKVEDIFKMHCYKLYFNFVKNKLPSKLSKYFQYNGSNNCNYKLVYFDCPNVNVKKRILYYLPPFDQ